MFAAAADAPSPSPPAIAIGHAWRKGAVCVRAAAPTPPAAAAAAGADGMGPATERPRRVRPGTMAAPAISAVRSCPWSTVVADAAALWSSSPNPASAKPSTERTRGLAATPPHPHPLELAAAQREGACRAEWVNPAAERSSPSNRMCLDWRRDGPATTLPAELAAATARERRLSGSPASLIEDRKACDGGGGVTRGWAERLCVG